MRKNLSAIDGQRKQFIALFSKIGKKRNFKGYSEDTILLTNIRDTLTNQQVADHVWFTYSRSFEDAELRIGDEILFEARVKKYNKGYINRSVGMTRRTQDFKLSHPSKIQIFKRSDP